MKLFWGRSKMDKTVASLRARTDALLQMRDAAKVALDAAVAERQAFAVSGDLDGGAETDRAMSKLQKAVDSAASSVAGLDSALDEMSKQLTAAESALTAERDRAARMAASEKIERDLAEIEREIAEFLVAGRTLVGGLEKLGTLVFDTAALAGYVARSLGEIELGGAVCTREISGAIDRIRDGSARIPEDAQQPEPVVEVLPPAPTVTVFILRHARYCDPATGALVRLHRYQDAVLSPRLAEIALRSGAATRLTDPVRKLNAGRWPPMNSASAAYDLDAIDIDAMPPLDPIEAPPAEETAPQPPPNYEPPPPIKHKAFEPLDRGKPYVINVPRKAAT